MSNSFPGDPDYDDTDDQRAGWLAIAAASLRGFCNKVAETYTDPEQMPEYQIASGLAIYMFELANSQLSSSIIHQLSDLGKESFDLSVQKTEEYVTHYLKTLAEIRENNKRRAPI
jgi:hypothetical protein